VQRPSQNDINHLNHLLDYAIIDQSRYDTIVDELKKPSVPIDDLKNNKRQEKNDKPKTINDKFKDSREDKKADLETPNREKSFDIEVPKPNFKDSELWGWLTLIFGSFFKLCLKLYVSVPIFLFVAYKTYATSFILRDLLKYLFYIGVVMTLLYWIIIYPIKSYRARKAREKYRIWKANDDKVVRVRECEQCKNKYTGTANEYCSRQCLIDANTCECLYCNKTYLRQNGYSSGYCSKRCDKEDNMKNCIGCGKTVHGNWDFCSTRCREIYNRR